MKEKFDFRAFKIFQLEDGIVHIDIKKISEMVVQDAIELYTCLGEIGKGGKIATLTTFNGYIPMNREVMAESMKKEFQERIFASAMVINSTGLRVAIRFFMTFHKPKQPRKIFDSEDSALQWLRKVKKEQEKICLV